MNSATTHLPSFYLIGLAVRTTNENNQAMQDIGRLWGKFLGEDVSSKIPDRISDDVYCIYTDYENDATGAYTTLLGHKVVSLENIPEGLAGKEIPAATYQVFPSKGKLPDIVVNTWKQIWNSDIERAYIADFERYRSDSVDPENAEVETYVSVK